MSDEITQWEYLKWGMKNHPGSGGYIVIILAIIGAGLSNSNILSGMIASAVGVSVMVTLYIVTSLSVGKANRRWILEERNK